MKKSIIVLMLSLIFINVAYAASGNFSFDTDLKYYSTFSDSTLEIDILKDIRGSDGILDGAIFFNKAQGYINYNSTFPIIPNGSDYSVSSWVNFDVIDSAVFQTMIASNQPSMEIRYIKTAGQLEYFDRNETAIFTVRNNVTAGVWHHIVSVRNGTHLNLYVDGVISSVPFFGTGSTFFFGFGDGVFIGAATSVNNYAVNGSMDEVLFINRSISQAEVDSLYQSGAPTIEARNIITDNNTYYTNMNMLQSVEGFNITAVNNVTISLDSFETNRSNNSIVLNGLNEYVAANETQDMDPTSEGYSVFGWVNISAVDGESQFFSKEYFENRIGLKIDQGYLRVFLQSTAGNLNSTPEGDGEQLVANTWYFIGMTIDRTDEQAYRYINAVKQTNGTGIAAIQNIDTNVSFRLGVRNRQDTGLLESYFNGTMDEVRIYNRTLTPAEIIALFLGTSIPVIDFFNEDPANGTITNQSILMNYTLSGMPVNSFCNISVEGTNQQNDINVSNGINEFLLNASWLLDGPNDINVSCSNSTFAFNISDTKTIIYDIIFPTIQINNESSFKLNNQSNLDQYLGDNFIVNVTFADETNLFAVRFNMSKDGTEIQSFTNLSINEMNFTMRENFSVSGLAAGVYDIKLSASDGHTKNEIGKYKVSKFINEIEFDTLEGNNIKIKGNGAYWSQYKKHKSKYSYSFNYLTKSKKRTFVIEADTKIHYIENSSYYAHFVVFNKDTGEGNWIDFIGMSGEYEVKYLKENKVEITFTNTKDSKHVNIESLGGLNTIELNLKWYKGNLTFTEETPVVTNSIQDFITLLTRNTAYIKNTEMEFKYNDITKTSLKFLNSTNTLFTSQFNIGGSAGINNVTATINITQFDDSEYSFSFNTTQTTVDATLLVSFFDENSELPILENISMVFETATETISDSTDTGNKSFLSLSSGIVKISAFNDNYPISSMFANITNFTQSIDFYMLNDTASTINVIYFIQDRSQDPVESALMTFSKRFNNTFKVVSQDRTDSLGLAKFHLDTNTEYTLVIDAVGFPVSNLIIKPILESGTITLDKETKSVYNNSLEGLLYSIAPENSQIETSNTTQEFRLDILDQSIGLAYFGLEILNNNFSCVPVSCITNVTNTPSGGSAIVSIVPNITGKVQIRYFYKRILRDENTLTTRWYNVFAPQNTSWSMEDVMINFKNELGSPVLLTVAGTIIQIMFVILAAQFGIVGISALLVISFVDMALMHYEFLDPIVGMLMIIVSVSLYVFLSRERL